MTRTYSDLIGRIAGRRILVLGDLMLDEYLWGDVRRISPEAPIPIVAVKRRSCAPGGAANAAANVASLGGVVRLAGVVGGDPAGHRLREVLSARGIAIDGVRADPGRITTAKTRVVAHHQHVVRVDEEQTSPLDSATEDALLAWAEVELPRADACILSDYGKGVVSRRVAERFIQMARSAGKPIVVDPKGIDFAKYRGATLVKPNFDEARLAAGDPHADLAAVSRHLLGLLEGCAVLVTRGADGMTLFRRDEPPFTIASTAREVFDVTGAGDTVAAVLALALAAGASPTEAAVLANVAAGIVVAKVGAAQPTREELENAAAALSEGH